MRESEGERERYEKRDKGKEIERERERGGKTEKNTGVKKCPERVRSRKKQREKQGKK